MTTTRTASPDDLIRMHDQGWTIVPIFDSSGGDHASDPQCLLNSTLAGFGTVLRAPRQTGPLRPRTCEEGRARSLSIVHGLGVLPLHTDTAHWPTPARYLGLLRTDVSSARVATYLSDAAALRRSESCSSMPGDEVFFVCSGARSFYTTIMSPSRGYVRLDAGCMIPSTPRGRAVLDLFTHPEAVPGVKAVHLRRGEALVIDNWRVLHGRGSAEGNGADRRLVRGLAA